MSKYNENLDLKGRNSMSLLLERIQPNSKVLEFGPAHGRMTKYMKEKLNCLVYSVEIDENAAKDAAVYSERMIVDGIENYNWVRDYGMYKFDYIIFADVLEHLHNPKKVIESSSLLLADFGKILISIPNIAHNSVIMDLLEDKFIYRPTGLLDDTHIRFFTKKTFDKMIQDCRLYRSFETAIYVDPRDTEFKNSYDSVPIELQAILQKSFAGEIYQYIYEITKFEGPCVSDFKNEYRLLANKFSQLNLNFNNPESDEIVLKIPVDENVSFVDLNFDVSTYSNISSISFRPYNDFCILEIERMAILYESGELEISRWSSSNACVTHQQYHFFESKSGKILFEGLPVDCLDNAKTICFRVKFVHRADDALQVLVKQLLIDRDQQLVQQLSPVTSDRPVEDEKCGRMLYKIFHRLFGRN